MPHRTIHFVQGDYYHIYNRGARRLSIFREPRNYHYVIKLMQHVAQECQLTVLVYCFLPNHYHWLVRQDGIIAAGILPRRVFGSYTQAYNRAYGEQGTLFQERYQARHLTTDDDLRQLCCYIHANPVKHGLIDSVDAWPYSNYADCIDTHNDSLASQQFIRDYFDDPQQYQAYVAEYLANRELPGR